MLDAFTRCNSKKDSCFRLADVKIISVRIPPKGSTLTFGTKNRKLKIYNDHLEFILQKPIAGTYLVLTNSLPHAFHDMKVEDKTCKRLLV